MIGRSRYCRHQRGVLLEVGYHFRLIIVKPSVVAMFACVCQLCVCNSQSNAKALLKYELFVVALSLPDSASASSTLSSTQLCTLSLPIEFDLLVWQSIKIFLHHVPVREQIANRNLEGTYLTWNPDLHRVHYLNICLWALLFPTAIATVHNGGK